MKVSVFGLGYVGSVTAACLARDGFSVVGVDANPEKTERIARGEPPIIELGLRELLQSGVASGRIGATTSARDGVARTDVSLVCVGTPTDAAGAPDMSAVLRVTDEIAAAAAGKGRAHVVVIRSTVLPGTTRECEARLAAAAPGRRPALAFYPEFLREGCAIRDYDAPAYTLIGTRSPEAEAAVRALTAGLTAPVLCVEPEVAECVKFASNAWHGAKVAFANEIGRVGKSLGVDSRQVMDILTRDSKLNVSAAYLRPGFAYGGSCLPKEIRALRYLAQRGAVRTPLLDALAESNAAHVEFAVERVLATGRRRVGLLGLAFKPGTDDLRESPCVDLVLALEARGCAVRILDAAVREATLIGTNRAYVSERLPRLAQMLVPDAAGLLAHAEVIVAAHGGPELRALLALLPAGTPFIDLGGVLPDRPALHGYDGIAW